MDDCRPCGYVNFEIPFYEPPVLVFTMPQFELAALVLTLGSDASSFASIVCRDVRMELYSFVMGVHFGQIFIRVGTN